MAGRDFSLLFNIGGRISRSFRDSFRNVRDNIEGIERQSKAAGKAMMAFSAVGVAGMGMAVKAFSDAESAATDLKSSLMISDGSVHKDYEKITKLAGDLGATLPGSTAEFTQMMNVLAKEGISTQQILGGMGEASAKMAVVMKMEFPEAAKFVAQLADVTKVASEDMVDFMDVIQRMAHTGLEADYMLQGFGKMASGMKTARMEGIKGVKAISPFLAMLGNSGMTDGGAAGNAMSKILSATVKSTSNAMGDFKDEFGKAAPDLKLMDKGEFGGITNLYKELDKLKGLTTEERNFYISKQFGNDAETIQALNIVIDKGQAGYDAMVKKMADQADLQQRVNIQLGTLANLWDAAKGAFDAVLISVGEQLAPQIKEIVAWLSEAQDGILTWSKANPQLFSTLVKVAGVTTLAVGALGALAVGIWALSGPFKLLFGLLKSMLWLTKGAFKVVFMLAKGLFFVGRAALVATAKLLMFVLRGVGMLAKGAMFVAVKTLTLLGKALLFVGRMALVAGRFMLANPIILAAMAIAGVVYLIYRNWDTIAPYFAKIWTSIKAFFSSGLANISATIINWSPIGLFYRVFAAVMSYFGVEMPAKFTDFGKNIIQGLINGIQNMASAAVEKAKAVAQAVASAVKGFFGINSPSKLFMQFGEWNMEGLANGMQNEAVATAVAAKTALSSVLPSSLASPIQQSPILSVSPRQASQGLGTQPTTPSLQITQHITVGNSSTTDQAKELANQSFKQFESQYNAFMSKKMRVAY